MTSNFDFRRDADGKPLWHNPLLNPDFDGNRPYEPDNHPFSTCALCGETWPCESVKAMTAPVPVTGIWLRTGRDAQELEVLAEIDHEWHVVIRQNWSQGDLLSHTVEPQGMRLSKVDSR